MVWVGWLVGARWRVGWLALGIFWFLFSACLSDLSLFQLPIARDRRGCCCHRTSCLGEGEGWLSVVALVGGCVCLRCVPEPSTMHTTHHHLGHSTTRPRGGMEGGGQGIKSYPRFAAASRPHAPSPQTTHGFCLGNKCGYRGRVSGGQQQWSPSLQRCKTSTPPPGTAGAPEGSASCRTCLRKSGKGAPIPNHRGQLTPTTR